MSTPAASPNPLQQLSGRMEDVFAEPGIQPRLRFTVNVNNRNNCGLELMNVTAKLHAQFLDEGHSAIPGMGAFVLDALLDRNFSPTTISPGDSGSWVFSSTFPFEIFAEFENQRDGRDVLFQMQVMYTVVERTPHGLLGARALTAEMVHERLGGNSFVPLTVPKSRWQTVLGNLGYSTELRISKQTLLSAVQAANKAKDEAEGAARAAKEASSLTGVLALADAYLQEATKLAKTSKRWLVAATSFAAACVLATLLYVVESFAHSEFTPSQTVARITVIAILFAASGLCLRSYNAYQHLELLNRHRVNIGKTFEVFKAAQPTDQAREVLAAITAKEMIDFGRVNFPGKDGADSQLSLLSELLKNTVNRPDK